MLAPNFSHALLVGSTGMLAHAARWVIARSNHSPVLGRSQAKLNAVTAAAPERATPAPIDHYDRPALQSLLRTHTDRYGLFDLALVWLHSDALPSLPTIADACAPHARLILLRSSATADFTRKTPAEAAILDQITIRVQRVVLGFIIEPAGSRWLIDEEISQGAIDAITGGEPHSVVGVTTPWEARP